MATPELDVAVAGRVLTVTFNRPAQRNAMTWAMYDGLVEACDRADADEGVRVMLLRGAGGEAFVAGTDITQFAAFETGADGVAYERRVGQVLDRLTRVTVPTIAAIEGFCVGGGLGLACACDLRIATPRSRFGIPIAATLGNCLAMPALALLAHQIGTARATELLLNARLIPASEALAIGLISEMPGDLHQAVRAATDRLIGHAPLTMWAVKESLRRFRNANLPATDDIIARVYGSHDFHQAVQAFTAKQRPHWTGH